MTKFYTLKNIAALFFAPALILAHRPATSFNPSSGPVNITADALSTNSYTSKTAVMLY